LFLRFESIRLSFCLFGNIANYASRVKLNSVNLAGPGINPIFSAILCLQPGRDCSAKGLGGFCRTGSAFLVIEEVQLLKAVLFKFEGAGLKTGAVEHQNLRGLLAGAHTLEAEFVRRGVVLGLVHQLSNLSEVYPFGPPLTSILSPFRRVNACLSRWRNVKLPEFLQSYIQ
jgi:hypothetical protein